MLDLKNTWLSQFPDKWEYRRMGPSELWFGAGKKLQKFWKTCPNYRWKEKPTARIAQNFLSMFFSGEGVKFGQNTAIWVENLSKSCNFPHWNWTSAQISAYILPEFGGLRFFWGEGSLPIPKFSLEYSFSHLSALHEKLRHSPSRKKSTGWPKLPRPKGLCVERV